MSPSKEKNATLEGAKSYLDIFVVCYISVRCGDMHEGGILNRQQ